MSRTTDDFRKGMMVRLSEGEQGQVERIDEDDNLLYVRVSLPGGETDLVDVDPGDVEPLETIG